MDKRRIKTHKLIKLTFLKMLKTYELNDITISELCKNCNIHCKTFYAHFKNTSEILEEIYDNLILDISSLYQDILSGSINDFHEFFQKVNEYLLKDIDIYKLLVKNKEHIQFIARVNSYFTNKVLDNNQMVKLYSGINKYSLYFLISGATSLYTYWIKNCESENIEKISSICEQIFNRTLIIEKRR